MKIIGVLATKAVLSWEPIPRSHRNGTIVNYVVRYDHEILPENTLEHESQTTENQLEIVLTNLRPNTDYIIRVAGANSAGVGIFSLPKVLITLGGKQKCYM